jgi:hypothetical protein
VQCGDAPPYHASMYDPAGVQRRPIDQALCVRSMHLGDRTTMMPAFEVVRLGISRLIPTYLGFHSISRALFILLAEHPFCRQADSACSSMPPVACIVLLHAWSTGRTATRLAVRSLSPCSAVQCSVGAGQLEKIYMLCSVLSNLLV